MHVQILACCWPRAAAKVARGRQDLATLEKLVASKQTELHQSKRLLAEERASWLQNGWKFLARMDGNGWSRTVELLVDQCDQYLGRWFLSLLLWVANTNWKKTTSSKDLDGFFILSYLKNLMNIEANYFSYWNCVIHGDYFVKKKSHSEQGPLIQVMRFGCFGLCNPRDLVWPYQ